MRAPGTDISGNLSRGTGHLKDNYSFTQGGTQEQIRLFWIVTGPKVIPSSWTVMPVSLVSLRVPTLRILFGRNLRNSFTLSEDAEIFKSIQRSVCAHAIAYTSLFPIRSHLESQSEQKKGEECKQPQLLDNHREQSDKAIKAFQTQKRLLQFHKVWGSLNTQNWL